MKIDDLTINIKDYGNPKLQPIVLLPGWGQNIEMMEPLMVGFEENFRIVILDVPGFGQSEEPKTVWTVYDYLTFLEKTFMALKIENPVMIGHSFGGKLSLLYASIHKVEKLIVLAPSFKVGITKKSLKTKLLKGLKKVPVVNKLEGWAKDHIGSDDYRAASPQMKQILVETVNTGIEEEIKKINAPTIAIWGSNDDAVPVEQAYELEESIKDLGLIIYPNCTHYAYLEDLPRTKQILKSFLMEGE